MPVGFLVTPGTSADRGSAVELIRGLDADALLAEARLRHRRGPGRGERARHGGARPAEVRQEGEGGDRPAPIRAEASGEERLREGQEVARPRHALLRAALVPRRGSPDPLRLTLAPYLVTTQPRLCRTIGRIDRSIDLIDIL